MILEIQVVAAGARENVGVIVGHIVPVTVKLSILFVPFAPTLPLLLATVLVLTTLK